MKRVLVLGGGGIVGVAWETGLVAGLQEAGLDPCAMDAIVGTSAGAIVGAQLAAGRLPGKPQAAGVEDGVTPPSSTFDPTKLDGSALRQIFQLWNAMHLTTAEEAAVIGKLARGINRESEAGWIDHMAHLIQLSEWPRTRLLIVAVDTLSGERRVFERESGASLARVVAASSAVPGVFPSVEIEGRFYMDGQVHSSTNADVVAGWKPEQVLIAMPTNGATARGIGRHADRMLATEVALLEAAGSRVTLRTPSEADATRFGGNLMDSARTADAYAIGLEAGRTWPAEIG